MAYKFWGAGNADVKLTEEGYEKINTPGKLYDVLSTIWCADTCAPRLRDGWTIENKTLGQCSITAFAIQDLFGGNVYGIPLSGGGAHCYNEINGVKFDLTSEQFGDEVLDYEKNPLQSKAEHMADAEKKSRYEYLKKELINKSN